MISKCILRPLGVSPLFPSPFGEHAPCSLHGLVMPLTPLTMAYELQDFTQDNTIHTESPQELASGFWTFYVVYCPLQGSQLRPALSICASR